jgi:hypothetical protein
MIFVDKTALCVRRHFDPRDVDMAEHVHRSRRRILLINTGPV